MPTLTVVNELPPEESLRLAVLLAQRAVPNGDCWDWTGPKNEKGYGTLHAYLNGKRRFTSAHRIAWLIYRSDVEPGLVIDHLCRNRACINPWHLEPVTPYVNQVRGKAQKGYKREPHWKTGGNRWAGGVCSAGHDITKEENLYYEKTSGGRITRRCYPCAIDRLKSKQRLGEGSAA